MTKGIRAKIKVELEIDGFHTNPAIVHELDVKHTLTIVEITEASKRAEKDKVRLIDPKRHYRDGSEKSPSILPGKLAKKIPFWMQVIGLLITGIGAIASVIACFI